MKALVLDGSADAGSSRRAIDALAAELKSWRIDTIALREKRIAPCEGCFGCWIRTPGECIIKDDAPSVTRAMMTSELVVLLCPVTFGGYSSELKKALDRSIGLVLPFFETIGGEVHHSARYERYPSMLGVGIMRASDEEGATMFATLVRRNAINMHSPAHAAGVVLEGDSDDALREKLRPLLAQLGDLNRNVATASLESRVPSPRVQSPDGGLWTLDSGHSRRALLLIGSARVSGKSNSDSLGTYLAERLRERGCKIEKLRIISSLRSDPDGGALTAAADRADLIVLSAPLYVDSAPATVIRALEILAARRPARGPALVAIVNNGFPEAHHNDTAIALYRRFAAEMGWRWAGGIAVGMGEILGGKSLEEAGAVVRRFRKALDLAAAALAEGRDVPTDAIKMAARRPIPHWFYTFIANRGWTRQARKNGVADRLLDRPYL